MKRIVFELIFIATTWYIFLPPLNLTSWEFLFFLCGHLLVVAVLFGFGKGINLVKTVHVRHGKAEAALNLEGFKINRKDGFLDIFRHLLHHTVACSVHIF